MILFVKAQSHKYIRRWKDDTGKWRYEYPKDVVKQQERDRDPVELARGYFESATENMGWASGVLADYLEQKYGISSFGALKKEIEGASNAHVSDIYRSIKSYVDKIPSLPQGAKGELLHRIGQSLIHLRNTYATKTKLMVKRKTPGGKVKYEYKAPPSPAFPPTQVKKAKAKLGSWTDMSELPSTMQMRELSKTGVAEIEGKLSSKRETEVYQKLEHHVVPFKADAGGVTFKLRQYEPRKQRTKTTATIMLTVPYPYARQFMKHHIKSVKTRNNIIGQMERSAGYKAALGVG